MLFLFSTGISDIDCYCFPGKILGKNKRNISYRSCFHTRPSIRLSFNFPNAPPLMEEVLSYHDESKVSMITTFCKDVTSIYIMTSFNISSKMIRRSFLCLFIFGNSLMRAYILITFVWLFLGWMLSH